MFSFIKVDPTIILNKAEWDRSKKSNQKSLTSDTEIRLLSLLETGIKEKLR